jgi:flagellin FlaB
MTANLKQVVKHLGREEAGITALETAIILIAFVVVASVFAFTILSAGTFSTERGKEAILAGLSEVQSSMEIKGSVIAKSNSSQTQVDEVIFTVANAIGGAPVNLDDDNQVVVIDYRDSRQTHPITDWTVEFLGTSDSDSLLENGELAQITVPLSLTLSTALTTTTPFALEIKPPSGAVLNIQRTTPAFLELVMDLQ